MVTSHVTDSKIQNINQKILTLLYFTMYSKIGAPPSSCFVMLILKLFPLLGCPCMEGGLGSPKKEHKSSSGTLIVHS